MGFARAVKKGRQDGELVLLDDRATGSSRWARVIGRGARHALMVAGASTSLQCLQELDRDMSAEAQSIA